MACLVLFFTYLIGSWLSWSELLTHWEYHSQMSDPSPSLCPEYFLLILFLFPRKFIFVMGTAKAFSHPYIWGQSHCLSALRLEASVSVYRKRRAVQECAAFFSVKACLITSRRHASSHACGICHFLTSSLLRSRAIYRKPRCVFLSVLRAGIGNHELPLFSSSSHVLSHLWPMPVSHLSISQ